MSYVLIMFSIVPWNIYLMAWEKVAGIASVVSRELFRRLLSKQGLTIKCYSVHTIRHSFATHLVDNGTDLHTVKELLGHSSLGTTMQYLHLSHKRMEGVINPFDMLPINVAGPLDHTTPGSLLQQNR